MKRMLTIIIFIITIGGISPIEANTEFSNKNIRFINDKTKGMHGYIWMPEMESIDSITVDAKVYDPPLVLEIGINESAIDLESAPSSISGILTAKANSNQRLESKLSTHRFNEEEKRRIDGMQDHVKEMYERISSKYGFFNEIALEMSIVLPSSKNQLFILRCKRNETSQIESIVLKYVKGKYLQALVDSKKEQVKYAYILSAYVSGSSTIDQDVE